MAEPWYRDGLRFECTRCGHCCTGAPGYVWVDAAPATLFPLVDVTIGHAAAVCAIEMARQHAVMEAQLHLRGNFVEKTFVSECILQPGGRSQRPGPERRRHIM